MRKRSKSVSVPRASGRLGATCTTTGSRRRRDRSMRAFHADAIVTGDAQVLRDAAVVVGAGGQIADVGQADALLPRHAGVAVERVRGAILPGLVNAHTHLELSGLRGQVPGGAGFLAWVEQLIGQRLEAAPEENTDAIERAGV